jgi:hypothetical protein
MTASTNQFATQSNLTAQTGTVKGLTSHTLGLAMLIRPIRGRQQFRAPGRFWVRFFRRREAFRKRPPAALGRSIHFIDGLEALGYLY